MGSDRSQSGLGNVTPTAIFATPTGFGYADRFGYADQLQLCRPARPACYADHADQLLHWTQKVIYNFDLHEGTLQRKLKSERFGQVRTTMLNRKAVTMGELYVSDQQQFGGNKTGEHLSEFIANITLGLVASVINLFSSMAEQYASWKPTNFFNPQDGIGSGDIKTLFDVVLNDQNGQWERWQVRVPIYKYNPQQPYEEILVQTEDTVATTTMLDILNKAKTNIIDTGTTGSVN
ncbi:MAG: hypothetical protein EZS28_025656, partial [Streblomastix strix]